MTETTTFEPYDSEALELARVARVLNERRLKFNLSDGHQRANFRREARQRFEEAGFTVHVNIRGEVDADGNETGDYYEVEIVPTGRVEKHVFDHDRMVHEVTNDLLERGEGGVIKSDPDTLRQAKDHGHGH